MHWNVGDAVNNLFRSHSTQEVGPDPQHLFNTHVLLDASGETAAVYRKVRFSGSLLSPAQPALQSLHANAGCHCRSTAPLP